FVAQPRDALLLLRRFARSGLLAHRLAANGLVEGGVMRRGWAVSQGSRSTAPARGRGGGEARSIGRPLSGPATAGERRPDQATREEPVGWPLPPEQLPAGWLCRDRPSLL